MADDSPTPAAPAGSEWLTTSDAELEEGRVARRPWHLAQLWFNEAHAQRAAREAAERERDTISCNAIPTWPACEDGLDRKQHNEPVCWGCYSAEKAIRREVESQLSAATAREAGLRALCEEALQVAEAYCPRQRDIGDCASCGALRARLASLAAPEGGTDGK